MNCKNCNAVVKGKFCSECGQNINVGVLTFGGLLNELSQNIFQVDKGFFFTLKEMFVQPGLSIRNYLSGKRKSHFKPIAYLLILSTIYFLIIKVSGQETWIDNIFSGWTQYSAADSDEKIMPPAIRWASDNYAYVTLICIPLFSLTSLVFFRKERATYVEHIVLNSYITGHQALLYSLFAILKYFFNFSILELLPFLISIGYNIWVFNQFFNNSSKIKNTFRIAFTYLLYIILFGLISLIIIAQSASHGINIQI